MSKLTDIKSWDTILTPQEMEEIDKIASRPRWQFGATSSESSLHKKFWKMDIKGYGIFDSVIPEKMEILIPFKFAKAVTKKVINENLTKKQKEIMFNEGTERPFTSDLLNEKREGFYHCANCGAKLFASTAKFDSGTGWPSFTEALPGAFKTKIDYSFGMKRIEYHCANCGVHHGHVFADGPSETGKRFCNNGLCLIFKPSSSN